MSAVKLTKVERLVLANQCEMLGILKPDEKKHFDYMKTSLEHGYEGDYPQILERISDGLPAEQCEAVINILQMHRALLLSYLDLADKAGITPEDVAFAGFDGNIETRFMAYCRHFCDDQPIGRFSELARGDDFNSHAPMMVRYLKMLVRYAVIGKGSDLTADEIKRIILMTP